METADSFLKENALLFRQIKEFCSKQLIQRVNLSIYIYCYAFSMQRPFAIHFFEIYIYTGCRVTRKIIPF